MTNERGTGAAGRSAAATRPRPAPAQMRVFINYRREDASGHAAHLYETLVEELGDARVFMDVETMEPGVDFAEAIDRAVSDCDVLIALIGRYWLASPDTKGRRRLDNPNDYVRLEIEAALQHGVRVIPVLVDGATMPEPEELPGLLSDLSRRQALEITPGRWAFDAGRLLAVLKRLEGGADPPEPLTQEVDSAAERQSQVRPAAERPAATNRASVGSAPIWENPRKRLAILVAAGVAVLGLFAGLLVSGSEDNNKPPQPSQTTLAPAPAAAPAPAPAPGAFPNAAEQELLNHVPTFIRNGNTCRRPADPVFKEAVGVSCDASSDIAVSYYKFHSTQEMNASFDGLVADKGLKPGTCRPSENAAFAAHGKWSDPAVGRYACYMSGKGNPWIEWTFDALGIYAYAFGIGDDKEAQKQDLYKFWIDAGPFK
jgi:hypothetical protein